MKVGNEKEVTVVMRTIRRLSEPLLLLLSFLLIPTQHTWAQTPLKTIDMPQGGKIVYGLVDGAGTQAAAAIALLRTVHKNCGEKPQIAQVFKVRGTDSIGVFFTVVNHPGGNKQVAGLIVAAPSGPQQVDAAMVTDDASRFGSTVNPMLAKLFSVWHPGSLAAASGSAAGARTASASGAEAGAHPAPANGPSAPAAALRNVSAADNSATIGIPDGWTLDPRSAGGTMVVSGPQGEQVALNMLKTAVDPTHPQQIQMQRYGIRSAIPGVIYYPFRGDLMKEFPALFQAWRRANGKPPVQLQIDLIEPMQAIPGNHCVHVKGHMDPDGKGMQALNDMMCALDVQSWGGYSVMLSHSLVPNDLADKEHNTLVAMVTSFQLNQEVLNQQMSAALRQKEENDRMITQNTQQAIDRIHAIGAQATARMNATEAANDAQHAAWWGQQDNNARNSAGFANYQRDQTVIRDVQNPDSHATVWNQTAAWMQQAFPDRIEEVPTSQYIKGQDY